MSDIYCLASGTIIICQIYIVWHLGLSLYVRYLLSGIWDYHYMSDIYCLASGTIIICHISIVWHLGLSFLRNTLIVLQQLHI